MSYSLRSIFLIIAILFPAHIRAAALFEYNNTIAKFNAPISPHCYDDDDARHYPVTLDCLQARQRIPVGEIIGMFHRGGPSDGFQLPLIVSARTCTILIGLEDDLPELTTWSAINLATTALILICSKITDREAKTGGFTHVGQGQQIKISLLKLPSGDLGLDDITESASTS